MAVRENQQTQNLDSWLARFDMDFDNSGLVRVAERNTLQNPYERVALETAARYDATAVYFRRFPNNSRPSIPQIYIYDNTMGEKEDGEIAKLHKYLWNSGQVPLFFVFGETDVKIFNCLKPPDLDEHDSPRITTLTLVKLAADIQKALDQFSARLFDNGSFWETSPYKGEFKQSETAYEQLLLHLKKIRREFLKENILPKPMAHKLLVMSILVKYLEEREDKHGKRVFPDAFFEQYGGAKDFIGVLRRPGHCCKLFQELKQQFRGKIFECTDEENTILAQKDLSRLADFLSGKVDLGDQYHLWSLYSFNHLPVELISNIYEEFLKEENGGKAEEGVIYTPPYLVNLLIDECMPLDKEHARTQYKVLDPACGSGVFLVAAYRRIVAWWKIQHQWEQPDLEILKQLLTDNIYGVDIKEEAVRLTVFSLILALCDLIDPKIIWKKLKFDELDNFVTNNLRSADFFELVYHKKFDLLFDSILGNPPFIKVKGEFAKKVEQKRTTEIWLTKQMYAAFLKRFPHAEDILKPITLINNEDIWIDRKQISTKQKNILGTETLSELQRQLPPKVPTKQLALLFLDQAIRLCKPKGLLCLILPAGVFLYNNNSIEFRKYFLQKYNVLQILDFTALTEVLFGSYSVAPVAVFAQKEVPHVEKLLHVTVRRTKAAREKIYFELDHYDFHRISYQEALNNRLIWKADLLGGGRIFHLMSRFVPLRSFGKYLKDKTKNDNWVISEGFIIGNKKEIERLKELKNKQADLSAVEVNQLDHLEKKYKKAAYLTTKRTLPTDAFTENGIDESQIDTLTEEYFLRRRQAELFKRPLVLIKEVAGKRSIPVVFRNEDISFKHQIIGIHAPQQQIDELKEIEIRIKNNNIYLFYVACISGRYMINKATSLLKSDIDNLPYPEERKDLELSEIEKILIDDILDSLLEFRKKGENAKIVKKNASKQQLRQFGELYCDILNSVYNGFNPCEPIFTESFICFPFYFGQQPDLDVQEWEPLEEHLNHLLIRKKEAANLRIVRVMRIYDKNLIFLVKPKQLRYWLRSVAIRDADETFVDLCKQGY